MKTIYNGSPNLRPRPRSVLVPGIFSLLLLFSCAGNAAESGDFTYEVSQSTVTITWYAGQGGAVAIPGTIAGMPVTRIGAYAFFDCSVMTSVTIPESVTSIEASAFEMCTGLTTIRIPKNVTSIGDGAFFTCTGLASIRVDPLNLSYSDKYGVLFDKTQRTLLQYPIAKAGGYRVPDTATSIGLAAFEECTGLTSLALPESVTYIEDWAFLLCTGLTSLALPEGVTNVGRSAFADCIALTNITLPNTVTRIWDEAFAGSGLTRLTLPSSVTTIGQLAFSDCTRLSSLTFPDSVTTIEAEAFGGCTGLRELTLPVSVTTIGDGAFAGCSGLVRMTIDTAATDWENIFRLSWCTIPGPGSLSDVNIGRNVADVHSGALYWLTALTNITVDGLSTEYSDRDGVLFNKGQSTLLRYPGARVGGYKVPNNVTRIESYAFRECKGLTSLTVPNSVISIGWFVFDGCNGLSSVTVDAATIDGWFSGLKTLKAVTIGKNVANIRYGFHGCAGLTSITVDALNADYGDRDGVLFDKAQSTLIQYPIGREGGYAIPGTVTNIMDSAFSGSAGLTSLALPNSVSGIGERAFDGCTGLVSLTVDTTTLGATFSGFTNLNNVTIGNGVTRIDGAAFSGCTGLMNIAVDPLNRAYSDKDGVLFSKDKTTLIQYPVARVGGFLVPNGVTNIGESAFSGSVGLMSLSLPESVTDIGNEALSGCLGLVSLYFAGNAPTLGVGAFEIARKSIVYHLAGTAGWGMTFGGRPTAIWVEQPSYSQWANASGLAAQYPTASGEQDDPDQDGMTNIQEMAAGTDPTNPHSTLILEVPVRPGSLGEDGKASLDQVEFALHFQSVPGKGYEIQRTDTLGGAWSIATGVEAATARTRVAFERPAGQRFYRVTTPGVTAGMVSIPAGSFIMGDSIGDGTSDQVPTHPVAVSAIYMDRCEVTKGLWDEVKSWAIGHGYSFDNDGAGLGPNYPVERVNWYDVVKWCNARSEKEGRVAAFYTDEGHTTVYRTGRINLDDSWVKWTGGYRLPTEAEWEHAARGGLAGKRFSWGDTITHSEADYHSSTGDSYDLSSTRGYHPYFGGDPKPYTSPVGWFPASLNGYGLQDMAGNVSEWCWDWYGAYSGASSTDPRGPTMGSYRVNRGGGWSSNARDCRSAYRGSYASVFTGDGLGFRSVLAPGQ